MLESLKEMLLKAQKGAYAVPHFNVWNVEMLQGVKDAAEECSSPVILSFGTGFTTNTEIEHFAPMLISAARAAKVPAAVHWDHGRNFAYVRQAVELGFTAVMIDASANPLDINIRLTREVVDAFQHLGIPVEAELGHVGAETKYEDALAHYGYTDPAQAKEFIAATGVDALAVAIGNMHGVYSSEPKIDFAILGRVREAVDVPLVLHGASGIGDADVRKCIALGCTKINIHTELCQAAMSAISASAGKLNYLELQQVVRIAIKERAKEKIRLFGSEGRAGA